MHFEVIRHALLHAIRCRPKTTKIAAATVLNLENARVASMAFPWSEIDEHRLVRAHGSCKARPSPSQICAPMQRTHQQLCFIPLSMPNVKVMIEWLCSSNAYSQECRSLSWDCLRCTNDNHRLPQSRPCYCKCSWPMLSIDLSGALEEHVAMVPVTTTKL